jgi:MFS family permease
MRHTDDPLVPPALFRSRAFTVTNLATVLLYSALGVSFFLVAYELQVAVGWSALRAGTALLPATVLMFALAAKSGSLAQRIGPRLQLTVGPLLASAGLLLLARIGPHASWGTDVLPGAVVFGLGLVTFVAPLTATVMGSVDPDHVSVASGVNNAIARTAGLAALAVVPVISGLSVAAGAAQVTHAFRVSLVIAACLAAAAAPLSFVGLAAHTRARRSARTVYCSVDGPPLQPDPGLCPPVQVARA